MNRLLATTLLIVVATSSGPVRADALTALIQEDLVRLGYALPSTDGEMTVETAVAISQFQAERGLDVTGEATPQLAGVIKAAINNPDMPAPAVQTAPAPQAAQPAQAQQGSTIGAIAGAMAPSMMRGMVSGATGIDPAMLQAVMGGEPAGQAGGMDPEAMQAMQAQMTQMIGGAADMDQAGIDAMQAAQMEAIQQQAAEQAQQACLQQKIAEAQAAQQSQQRRRGFGSLMRAVSRLGGDEIAASVAGVGADIAEANAVIDDLESAARDLGLTEEEVASCGVTQ